jgi:hypothetical protein
VRGIWHIRQRAAAAIADRIIALADDAAVKADSVVAIASDNSTDIMAGDRFIMSILDGDAELDKVPRQVLAKAYAAKIRTTIESYRRDRGSRSIVRSAAAAGACPAHRADSAGPMGFRKLTHWLRIVHNEDP